jgi:hypothetical protein
MDSMVLSCGLERLKVIIHASHDVITVTKNLLGFIDAINLPIFSFLSQIFWFSRASVTHFIIYICSWFNF